MIIETPGEFWKDYELIDSGDFEKLERFGEYIIARPELKANWEKSIRTWDDLIHARFKLGSGLGKPGKEDSGSWERFKKIKDPWFINYNSMQAGLSFKLRLSLTSFKHIGIFPEQASNWDFIYKQTRDLVKKAEAESSNKPKILNLFAYTGAASLAAKAAGADVTHLDSLKQVITWANKNMELSSMNNIRWVVEDALKFVRREARRGNLYQGIILDPPPYGHGPKGEKWKLDDCLSDLLGYVNQILAKEDSFMVLNLYSSGYTTDLAEAIIKEAFNLRAGRSKAYFDSGELALRDSFGKNLPLSVFVRLVR